MARFAPNRREVMEALGQSNEEIDVLLQHDAGEDLHAFVADDADDDWFFCVECGDTEDGLMHNNAWRNVEPLL